MPVCQGRYKATWLQRVQSCGLAALIHRENKLIIQK